MASLKEFEKRIVKLEQSMMPADPLLIVLADFAGVGELHGWKVDGSYVARLPGESEEDLGKRVHLQGKAYGRAHALQTVCLMEDREHEPSVEPEPYQEPVTPTIRAKAYVQPKLAVVEQDGPPSRGGWHGRQGLN